MEIKGEGLRGALREIAGRKPFISDWRKASNGRLVRFFDWRKGGARRAAR